MTNKIDIQEYYEKYGPMVYRRCRQMLKDDEKARDAAQDVIVQLLRKQDTLKPEYPSSLLNTMATNICLNIIRSAKRKGEVTWDEKVEAVAHISEPERGWMAGQVLEKIFSKEKVDTRTIATLHYIDGLTLEEVSREVGMSVSGVRKRLRLLRENVKNIFGEEYVTF